VENELELVERVRGGDADAFEQLMRAYQSKVYNTALRMTGSREDAFDISQEVFVRVYRSISLFRSDSSFSTWIYRLCSNMCIDFLRKRKHVSEVSLTRRDDEGEIEGENEVADNQFDPERAYENAELREKLFAAIDKLSEEHRQAVVLRDIEGLSYAQIAEVAGIEEGTVKSRISRAREALRVLLREGNFFSDRASNRSKRCQKGGDAC